MKNIGAVIGKGVKINSLPITKNYWKDLAI